MTTLKGIFPNPKPVRRKNFIQENVKNLRRMEQFFHTKEVEDFQKLQLQKKSLDKYQNVTARINSSFQRRTNQDPLGKPSLRHSEKNLESGSRSLERKASAPIPSKPAAAEVPNRRVHKSPTKVAPIRKTKDQKSLPSKCQTNAPVKNTTILQENFETLESHEKDCIKYRSQGIQTLDTDDMDTLYKEGIIRYPSSRSSKHDGSPTRNPERSLVRDHHQASDMNDLSPTSPRRNSTDLSDSLPGDHVDHVKLNKQKVSISGKFAAQLNNGGTPPNYRKGVVPKYIRERKEAQQQRDEKIKAAASNADCPDGHIPLPDEERKETLRMLKKHYQDFVNELNMMPIRSDTLRSQRRKMEIEKQLNKLEEGIKVFSRPKVYVKVNA